MLSALPTTVFVTNSLSTSPVMISKVADAFYKNYLGDASYDQWIVSAAVS